MELDTIINALLSMGVPGVLIATFLLALYKYAPKAIEAYKKTKEIEQQAFTERQREYREQSERIVEVATASTIAIEKSSSALDHNSKVNEAVISALGKIDTSLSNLIDSFKTHDRRTEEMNVDVKRILENARKGAAE